MIIIFASVYDGLILIDRNLHQSLEDSYEFFDMKDRKVEPPNINKQEKQIKSIIQDLNKSIRVLQQEIHINNGFDITRSPLMWRYPPGYEHQINQMYTQKLNLIKELTVLTKKYDFVEFASIVDNMTLTTNFFDRINFVSEMFAIDHENILILLDGGNQKVAQLVQKITKFIDSISSNAKIKIVALGQSEYVIVDWIKKQNFDYSLLYNFNSSQFKRAQLREFMQYSSREYKIFRGDFFEMNMNSTYYSQRQKFIGFIFTSQIEYQAVEFLFPMTLYLLDSQQKNPAMKTLSKFRNVQYIFDHQTDLLLDSQIYFTKERNYAMNFGDALPIIQKVSQNLINYITIYQGMSSLYPQQEQYQIQKDKNLLYFSMPLYIDTPEFGKILLGIVTIGIQSQKAIISEDIVIVKQGGGIYFSDNTKTLILQNQYIMNILYQIAEREGQISIAMQHDIVIINWLSLQDSYKIVNIGRESLIRQIRNYAINQTFIDLIIFQGIVQLFNQDYCNFISDRNMQLFISVNEIQSKQKQCQFLLQNQSIVQFVQDIFSIQNYEKLNQRQYFIFKNANYIICNFPYNQENLDYIQQFKMISISQLNNSYFNDTILSINFNLSTNKIYYICQQFVEQLYFTSLIINYQMILLIENSLPTYLTAFKKDELFYLIKSDFQNYYASAEQNKEKNVQSIYLLLKTQQFLVNNTISTNQTIFKLSLPQFCYGSLTFKQIFNYWFVFAQNFSCLQLSESFEIQDNKQSMLNIDISFFQDQQYNYYYDQSYFNSSFSKYCTQNLSSCENKIYQKKLLQLTTQQPFKSVFNKYYNNNSYLQNQFLTVVIYILFFMLMFSPFFL